MGVLDSIDSPADLRALRPEQLGELAEEIRGFLVDKVSRTGGHLGPNLGVVELTLALHRVFESPDDVLLWDTGHQSYVHKIITGPPRGVRPPAPAGRDLRVPVPRGEPARRDRELPRLDGAVLRRRHRQGLRAGRDLGEAPRRGSCWRRLPDRRDGVGGPEQHRRLPPTRDHRGQRQQALLRPNDRGTRPTPGHPAHHPRVRAVPRLGQGHAGPHARRGCAPVRGPPRREAWCQGRGRPAGDVRGPRAEVPRPGGRPRRGVRWSRSCAPRSGTAAR